MYRKMVEIRTFEEHVWDVYTRGLMPGLAHLYIGEEGVAVGACAALRDDDYITSRAEKIADAVREQIGL